ncbi:MAG: hypothetical protein Q9M18_01345, partial [Mariprofundaceae bacterium]|nr:hypothetical protein [Mariprofundaceae bacterium]
FNRYAYVLNNPLVYTDPSGHEVLIVNGNPPANGNGGVGVEVTPSQGGSLPTIGQASAALRNMGSFLGDIGTGTAHGINNAGRAIGRFFGFGGGGGGYSLPIIHRPVTWVGTSQMGYTNAINPEQPIAGASTNSIYFSHFNKLRAYPEIMTIEKKVGGLSLIVDTSSDNHSSSLGSKITFNPKVLNMEYLTTFPSTLENRWLSTGQDNLADEYFNKYDGKYYPFSIDRVLVHEIFHTTQSVVNKAQYIVTSEKYEKPAIEFTNDFMFKYFNEPYRLNHTSVRAIQ